MRIYNIKNEKLIILLNFLAFIILLIYYKPKLNLF